MKYQAIPFGFYLLFATFCSNIAASKAAAQNISPSIVTVVAGDPITPIQFSATGGNSSTNWRASDLPPNLVLSSDGVLSGIPSRPVTQNSTIRSSRPSASRKVLFTIQPNAPTISSPATGTHLGNATIGMPFGPVSIQASGGKTPYSWNATITRPNVRGTNTTVSIQAASSTSANLSGIFYSEGIYTIRVFAQGDNAIPQRSPNAIYTVNVVRNPPTVSTPPDRSFLGNATVGESFGPVTVSATGGIAPYQW
jgi:hypothetical protein